MYGSRCWSFPLIISYLLLIAAELPSCKIQPRMHVSQHLLKIITFWFSLHQWQVVVSELPVGIWITACRVSRCLYYDVIAVTHHQWPCASLARTTLRWINPYPKGRKTPTPAQKRGGSGYYAKHNNMRFQFSSSKWCWLHIIAFTPRSTLIWSSSTSEGFINMSKRYV